jgi:hypothetical protein
MITDPVFYALAVAAVILIGLSKGGFGGALALLGVPMVALGNPARSGRRDLPAHSGGHGPGRALCLARRLRPAHPGDHAARRLAIGIADGLANRRLRKRQPHHG